MNYLKKYCNLGLLILILCVSFVTAMEQKIPHNAYAWKTLRRYEAGGNTQDYWKFEYSTAKMFCFNRVKFWGAIADKLEWSEFLETEVTSVLNPQYNAPADFEERRCILPYFLSCDGRQRVIIAQVDDYSSILVSQIQEDYYRSKVK